MSFLKAVITVLGGIAGKVTNLVGKVTNLNAPLVAVIKDTNSHLQATCKVVYDIGEGYTISWGTSTMTFTNDEINVIKENTLTTNSGWYIKDIDLLKDFGFNIIPHDGHAGVDIPISINITSINEGLDLVVDVYAICEDKTAILTLNHIGMWEVFAPSDGSFILNGGGTFHVLKNN